MNKRILIIDDDKELCEEFMETLCAEDFDVSYALDSSSALIELNKKKIDVVFLDLRMHGLGWEETVNIFRRKYPGLRIFIVTGENIDKTLHERITKKAEGIILKPFTGDFIVSKLRAIIGE